MIWGLELIAEPRLSSRHCIKLLAFPIAVLTLAGALSGVPTIQVWPLHNGFGGMLGDIIFNMSAMAVIGFSPERGSVMAGAALGSLGSVLLLHSVGLRLDQVAALVTGRPWPEKATSAEPSPPVTSPKSAVHDAAPPTLHMPAASPPQAPTMELAGVAPIASSAVSVGAPRSAQSAGVPVRVSGSVPEGVSVGAMADLPADVSASERNDSFDQETEAQARAVAARFAHRATARVSEAATKAGGRTAASRPTRSPARAPKSDEKPTRRNASAPSLAPPAPVDPTPSRLAGGLSDLDADRRWTRPSLELLSPAAATVDHHQHLADADAKAGLLVDVLADFGVNGAIRDIKPGPVVTRYEFEPARGVKTSRVIGLSDDIARSLGAHSIRMAVVPGRNAIGIEVPNAVRLPVMLRDILASDGFTSSEAILPLALGRGIGGEPIITDLARMPHLLIAGTTGSGKSVGVNAMILSLIYRHDPGHCRLLLIDPKMLELAAYNSIPHLLGPVITDAEAAAGALDWAVGEMETRYQRMAKLGVRNIDGFNQRARQSKLAGERLVRSVQTGFDAISGAPVFEHEPLDGEPMPYIVIVVDEFADLMMTAGAQVEASIQRLAQMARAAGIHLIMATQRPSVDVVTGTIKANFPMRISFRVASRTDSRTIINEAGAEQLLGQGDMLISSGAGQPHRVHGAFVGDADIARVVASFADDRVQSRVVSPAAAPVAPVQRPSRAAGPLDGARRPSPLDAVYAEAVMVVAADRKVSPGHLHRRLAITEAMAGELIERLQREGVVGPLDRFGRREILIAAPATPHQAVA